MEVEAQSFAAPQSSFKLGLIHGVNPCLQFWLDLDPFVSGEINGRKVTILTIVSLWETAQACCTNRARKVNVCAAE